MDNSELRQTKNANLINNGSLAMTYSKIVCSLRRTGKNLWKVVLLIVLLNQGLVKNAISQHVPVFLVEKTLENDIQKKLRASEENLYQYLLASSEKEQLYQLFSSQNAPDANGKIAKAKAVVNEVLTGSKQVKLKIMPGSELANVWAAFSSKDLTNQPVIYLNQEVLHYQKEEDITRLLLEEFGHWLDHEVNGAIDTKGDEGQVFALHVLGVELSEFDKERLANENDHLVLEINGLETEVELAALLFNGQSYFAGIAAKAAGAASTGPAGQVANLESNTLYIGNPIPGGRALFVSDPASDPYYSGNNVRGTLYAVDNTNKITAGYFGEISRLIKEGSAPVAAQMYIYPSGTVNNVLATTIILDFYTNRYPTLNTGDIVKTSSDPVASALNSLLAVNTAPQANADTDVAELANCNPVRTTPTEAIGNVVTGVGTDNNTAGRDLDTDISYIVNLYSPLPNVPPIGELIVETDPLYVSAAKSTTTGSGATVAAGSTSASNFSSVTGSYGTLRIGADGSYKYTINQASSAVLALVQGQSLSEVFNYDVTDRKGGVSNITLTITINGGNEAPAAVNEYKFVEEANKVIGDKLIEITATGSGLLSNDTDPDASNTLKITQAEKATSTTDETFSSPIAVTATGAVTFTRTIGLTYNRVAKSGSWGGGTGDAVFISRDGTTWTNTGLFVNTIDNSGGSTKYLTFKTISGTTTTSNTAQYGYLDVKQNDRLSFVTAGTGPEIIGSVDVVSETKFVLTGTGTAPLANDAVTGDGLQASTKVASVSTLAIGGTTYTYITLDKTATVGTTNNSSTLNAGESLTFTQGGVIQGTYGYLNLKSDGTYSYVLTADIPNNQLVNEYFKYQISDASNTNTPGCTDAAVLHLQIQGAQVAPPTGTADAVEVIETGVSAGTSPLSKAASAGLLANDVLGSGGTAPLKVAKVWTPSTTSSQQSITTSVTLTGTYGSITINADGSYTYTLDNANATVNALNSSQTLTEVFYYQVADSQATPNTTISTLTITIRGANDAPVATDDGATAVEGGDFNNVDGVNPTGSVLPNDSDVDNSDTKTVTKIISGTGTPTAAVSNGTTATGSYGTLTINPDGTYTYVVNNANAAVDALGSGETLTETFTYEMRDAAGATSTAKLVITIQGKEDVVRVNNVSVNEGSPYIVFTVTGAPGQKVTLSLGTTGTAQGDAAGSGVDFGASSGTGLEYFDGTAWKPYVAGALVTLDSNGKLLVRTAIAQDTTFEEQESFVLNAITADGNTASGAGVIYDDGTGGYFAENNTSGTSAVPTGVNLDDDRTLTVSNVTVNEGSPYAVFTVEGVPGQQVTLSLSNTNESAEAADYGGGSGALQYFNTTTNSWTNYTPGSLVTLGTDGKLLVRTAITSDIESEGPETFKLVATNLGGVASTGGVGTIKDDGTGDYWAATNNTATPAVPAGVKLDDDRPLTVNNITVNEGSPYGVFQVSGAAGQQVKLNLTDGTAGSADYGPSLEYFDGTNWLPYTANSFVPLDANGKLFVRTPILQDTNFENAETFKLTATNTGGTGYDGTATITDNGSGDYWIGNNTRPATTNELIDLPADLDDDRLLKVNSIKVNEGSPYAVFTIGALANQLVKISLTNGTATAPADFTSSLEYFDGTNWVPYTIGTTVAVDAAGKLLVRVPIKQDAVSDNGETFTITVTNALGNVSSDGTCTIKDDGTGDYWAANNNTAAPAIPAGVKLDDDRPLTVNNITVNEGSPYAVFEVSGAAGQLTTLALANGTTTSLTGLEYSTDGGVTWTAYTSGTIALNSSGKLLVRTPLTPEQEAAADNGETFTLTATNTGGTAAVGTGTIKDDGTGTIFNADGTPNTTAAKDDDRPLTVNSITVNEASPTAVFEVSGAAGQLTTLALANGTTTGLTGLAYSTDGGATWTAYTSGTVALNNSGKLLVRTALTPEQEATPDNGETFTLTATNTGGTAAVGTGTIKDDGTGTIFNADGTPNTTAAKDDDRPLTVNSITVNEGSPYGVFEVSGAAGQLTSLALANGTTTSLTGLEYSTDGGVTWTAYTSGTVALNSSGKLLVRTPLTPEQEAAADNEETFTLTATNTGGTAAVGTGTIKDDGTGTIFNANGTPNTTAAKDDDRPLTVNSITVNEGSPYGVFEVSGAAGQLTTLALANGTTTGLTGLEYSTDGGVTWTAYTSGTVALNSSGKLLVRTALTPEQEAGSDNGETFTLTATNTGGTAAVGTGTIKDDGTGTIFNNDGTPNTTAAKDDDRGLTVNSIMVNEGSPYAVFEVSGAAGQLTTLALANGTSAGLTGLEYYNGTAWVAYTSGTTVALNTSGKLLVRTALTPEQEAAADNGETFTLTATNTGGKAAVGTGTIKDDGTGDYWAANNTTATPALPAGVKLDDDRPLTVNSITVNEGSPYAVFEVSGAAGQLTTLALANGTTNGLTGLEYSTDGGATWTAYTTSTVALNSSGKLLVRTSLTPEQELAADNGETFTLTATNTGGTAAVGTGTIRDDGKGTIFNSDGTENTTAAKDDDRVFPQSDVNSTYSGTPAKGSVATNDDVPVGTTYGIPTPAATNPAGATIEMNPDGTYTFNSTKPGVYTYSVPVCQANGTCVQTTLTITVLEPEKPAPPVLNTDLGTVKAGQPITIPTLVNDASGRPGVTLKPSSVSVTEAPKNGVVSVDPVTGNITYTPNPGFVGKDVYTYQVCDTGNPALCATATQEINVEPVIVPNAILAADDFVTGPSGTKLTGSILLNDKDLFGEPLLVTPQVKETPNGTFKLNPDGTFEFVPAKGFVGPVQFVYEVCTGGSEPVCTRATLYLLVAPNVIEAIMDNFKANEINGLAGGTAGNVLTNDLFNGAPVKAADVVVAVKNNGGIAGLTIDANGNLIVPKGTAPGSYVITYTICDVNLPSNCSEAMAMVEVFHGVNLRITKSAISPSKFEGDQLEFLIKVENNGTTDAVNVVATDKLDAGFSYTSSAVTGATASTAVSDQEVKWTFASLPAGKSAEITVRVKANPLADGREKLVANTATVSSPARELSPNDNSSTTSVAIKPFFLANVITPNGDGKNDAFVINGLGKFTSNELIIFDRWGSHVFQKKGYQNDWAGQGLVAGTYFYILSVVDSNGDETQFKGWIQLIRE